MFDISNNIITLNRGDTFSLDVNVNIGTTWDPTTYILEEGDKLYFALMEPNQPFECALIRKVFTKDDQDEDGCVIMNFKSEDTEFLLPGLYYYTIKLSREDDTIVDTIVTKTKFTILD